MKRLLVILLPVVVSLAWLAAGGPLLADFELLLEDGRVLNGVDVRREKGEYLLQMADGQTVSIPEELVAEVRITAGHAAGFGMVEAEPQQLEGDAVDLDDENRPASGMVRGHAEVLAGEEIRPPRTSEQTKALGPPAEFSKGVIDPTWRPESVFNASNDVTNFNPSTWAEDIVDHSWTPSSDYTQKSDVSNFAPSTWSESIVDNSWKPTDGFSKRESSFRRDTSDAGPFGGRPLLAYDLGSRPANQVLPASAGTVRRLGSARLSLVPALSSVTATTSAPSKPSPAGTAASGSSYRALPVAACTWCARFRLGTVSGTTRRPARQGPPADDLIRGCAAKLIPDASSLSETAQASADTDEEIEVRWIIDDAFAALPLDLYEATVGGVRAVFTYSPEQCRLITGDLGRLLGLEKMSVEDKQRFGVESYNVALALVPRQPAVVFANSADKIDYALAVSMLLTPETEDVKLLTRAEDLAAGGESCGHSDKSRRRGARKVDREFHPPHVDFVNGHDVVSFYSWDRRGGDVRSHHVRLLDGGAVDLESRLVVSHQGSHECGDFVVEPEREPGELAELAGLAEIAAP